MVCRGDQWSPGFIDIKIPYLQKNRNAIITIYLRIPERLGLLFS